MSQAGEASASEDRPPHLLIQGSGSFCIPPKDKWDIFPHGSLQGPVPTAVLEQPCPPSTRACHWAVRVVSGPCLAFRTWPHTEDVSPKAKPDQLAHCTTLPRLSGVEAVVPLGFLHVPSFHSPGGGQDGAH